MGPPPSSAPDWAVLDAALDFALDLDGDERDAYVASLDGSLRRALVPLLEAALAPDPVLDHPATALAALAAAPEEAAAGVLVGPYRLEALVGEGGMGRVYRARRADGAYDKTVAVKLVRQSLSLAGSDVSARLRRERALLATLDHPGIARLIDGGETPDGVPYLVTEFIDGAPITTWADAHGLGVRERVRLVAEVARAVDHAHRRFVIHRDLKPSNVLVTEVDGAQRPVVLDFGIAKLLDAEDDSPHAFPLTPTGMRLLTPAYAAPELYDPTSSVTTGADIYGLGALLYEVLTGRRPHDDAPSPGPATTEPTRPSRVVTEPAGRPPADGGARSRALRGDLDTICLKALHPDPARRYASANALAEDLDRYLAGRPVEARPDSLWYVTGRFGRRHRAVVGAGLIALLSLVGGLGVSLVSLEAERAARANAEAEALRAKESVDLLANVFLESDPYRAGQDVTIREVLGSALDRVRGMSSPETRGQLLIMFGRLHNQWGEFDRSAALYDEAMETLADGPPALWAQARYGLGRTQGGLGKFDDALQLFHAVYADLATEPDLAGLRFLVLRDISWIQRESGDLPAAIETAEQAVEVASGFDDNESMSLALYELAYTLLSAGRTDAALPIAQEVYDIDVGMFGQESAESAHATGLLARTLYRLERYGQAEGLQRTALDIQRRALGQHHPYTVEAHVTLSRVLLAAGRTRAGAVQADSAYFLATRADPDSVIWGAVHGARAAAFSQSGRYAEAERAAQAGLDWMPSARSSETAELAAYLALSRIEQGKPSPPSSRTVLEELDRSDPLTRRLYTQVRARLSGGTR